MEYLPNTYYWIKDEDDYVPIYHNHSKQWKVVIHNNTKFITIAKIRSLFGKNAIQRPIDFKNDTMFGTLPKHTANIMLFPYAFESDNAGMTVAMRNNNVILIDKMVIPASQIDDGYYIEYKEEA